MTLTAEDALAQGQRLDPKATRFKVRIYDGFDNCWHDC